MAPTRNRPGNCGPRVPHFGGAPARQKGTEIPHGMNLSGYQRKALNRRALALGGATTHCNYSLDRICLKALLAVAQFRQARRG
jgi:hypothetical protein